MNQGVLEAAAALSDGGVVPSHNNPTDGPILPPLARGEEAVTGSILQKFIVRCIQRWNQREFLNAGGEHGAKTVHLI